MSTPRPGALTPMVGAPLSRRALIGGGLATAVVLAAPRPAWAAELRVALDRPSLAVGDLVALRVQLIDGRPRGVPDVPVGDGLSARFRGQSQETVMVNFQTTRIITYTYGLSATAEGTWTIGPIEVEVDGRMLRAEALTVTVTGAPAGEEARAAVRASLSDASPFVGELLHYTLVFEHEGEAYNPRWTPPELRGFSQLTGTDPEQTEAQLVRDGKQRTITEIRLPLVASAPGAQNIDPAVLTADMPVSADARTGRRAVDLFGRERTRTETFATKKLAATVRPLPEPRPPAFSGLVGSFALEASQLPVSVELGGTLTWELRLVGRGSLVGFRLPAAPADGNFRVYDDAPAVRTRWERGGLESEALFRRALVPEAAGGLTVPGVELVVFDPELEQYVTLKAAGQAITVTPGADGGEVQRFGAPPAAGGGVVDALGDDILPAPAAASLGDRSLAGALPLLVGLPALPLLGLLGVELRRLIGRRGPPRAVDPLARLAALPAEPAARLAGLEQLFREVCAARLGVAAPALDRAQVSTLGPEAAALYAALEAARYGGAAAALPALEAQLNALITARKAGGAA